MKPRRQDYLARFPSEPPLYDERLERPDEREPFHMPQQLFTQTAPPAPIDAASADPPDEPYFVTPRDLRDAATKADVTALALRVITKWEGFRRDCYDDATGKTLGKGAAAVGIPTIGYGCIDREFAFPGNSITEIKARELLARDMQTHWPPVARLVSESPRTLTTHQIAALWSLCYNIGGTALYKSNTVAGRIRAGNIEGAADGFLRWVHSGGVRLRGLANRRADERELFLTSVAAGEDEADGATKLPDTPKSDKPVIKRSTEVPAAVATGGAGGVAMLWERFGELPQLAQVALIGLALAGPVYWIWRRFWKAARGEEA